MQKLTEQKIFTPFIGKVVNRKVFDNLARDYSKEYVIHNSRYMDDLQFRELFGVTDLLKEQWEYSGIDFVLYLTLDGDIITKGHLDKYRECGGGHGRPVVLPLKETQQELRIARRILEYITMV